MRCESQTITVSSRNKDDINKKIMSAASLSKIVADLKANQQKTSEKSDLLEMSIKILYYNQMQLSVQGGVY